MAVQIDSMKVRLVAVDLEPTPYKFDLWNAFVDSNLFELNVLYSSSKNWSSDGGHNYQELPPAKYPFRVLHGKGVISLIKALQVFVKLLISWKPDVVYISGYIGFVPLSAILICGCIRQKYVVHSDVFNNKIPLTTFIKFKYVFRNMIRSLIFRTSVALLNCGKRGCESAIVAGCAPSKALDFPYVVDARRLCSDEPDIVPRECLTDLASHRVVILLSARMIERKGVEVLLRAIAALSTRTLWVLWIEGDGPLLQKYKRLAGDLKVMDRCRFLGFCQMRLHSWLVRNAEIVVVPSLKDSWGIVVDEGMQMGKVVVSTRETGAGIDRIRTGVNGYLLPAGDADELAQTLDMSIESRNLRKRVGDAGQVTAKLYGPQLNVNTLYARLRETKEHSWQRMV